jgi:hypothetical protein
MHPVSILTFGIFFAGYITARWDLVTRLYELAIFAWDHGVIVCCDGHAAIPSSLTLVQTRAAKGFAALTILFLLFLIPIQRIAANETELVSSRGTPSSSHKSESDDSQESRKPEGSISAREQLRRRGSF